MARELDLQSLSGTTASVPALQVLTIDRPQDANLEASFRSLLRHVSGTPNENMLDREQEKKRKRGTAIPLGLGESVLGGVVEIISPPKKLRNGDHYKQETAKESAKVLSKSVGSLYESISSAQKELEAGRRWTEEMLTM